MAEASSNSDEEFIEFEEDDGEIVVIKSCSQLLKEAHQELDKRKEQIELLQNDRKQLVHEMKMLKEELSYYRNTEQEQLLQDCKISMMDLSPDLVSLNEVTSTMSSPQITPTTLDFPRHTSTEDDAHAPLSVSQSFTIIPEVVDPDHDPLKWPESNTGSCVVTAMVEKSCQTDFTIETQSPPKRLKHKATQTRFEKQLTGIFRTNSSDLTTSEERENARQQALNKRTGERRISLSNALGWPSTFKEVGLNMICHLKQTMDPFNMTYTLDNESTMKEYENLIDNSKSTSSKKMAASAAATAPASSDDSCQVTSDANGNQRVLVKCPYCSEEMDRCSIQRHIQSMCGALDFCY